MTAVLDFLVSFHDKGLTYTALNTARSAISAVTVAKNNMTIGSPPLVSLFMKGVYKDSPPTSRYESTWDVRPVLTYPSSLNPLEKLDLKLLTLKLVMLVALVSAQRGQSLHMLDFSCMKDVPDNTLNFCSLNMSNKVGRFPSVVLKAYPAVSSLCVSKATSKAKAASVSIPEILRTAGWSSSRCFDQFYNKPVETSTFASAVLQIE